MELRTTWSRVTVCIEIRQYKQANQFFPFIICGFLGLWGGHRWKSSYVARCAPYSVPYKEIEDNFILKFHQNQLIDERSQFLLNIVETKRDRTNAMA